MKSEFTIEAKVANQNWPPQFDDVQIEVCLQMTGPHVKLSHRDYKNRFEPMETYSPTILRQGNPEKLCVILACEKETQCQHTGSF